MENFTLDHDIKTFYVKAETFPAGIMNAFDSLKKIITHSPDRDIFGISYGGPNGSIIYMAAAKEKAPGEGTELKCPSFTIRKGRYTVGKIDDWAADPTQISALFRKLLDHPELDKNGYCVEWYKGGKEVLCMVKLTDI